MKNNWLDMQHRGFSAYHKEIQDAELCKKFNHAIVSTDRKEETVDTVFCDCAVSTDWIAEIEKALPFIENAVRENRQFILRQGETVLIEKAKRVSKASVEHLSRHSEFITTLPAPEEDLIPDKIYMTENIGTHTVYENRFLYMLLCYLHDFVGFRYKKIMELVASFSADVSFNKEFTNGARKIKYTLNYSETSQGEDGACDSNAQEAIARIRNILQTVELLLKSDLMREVSGAPMLKPPIARTNVLLHNPNFKVAFELYSFLTAYTEDGYEKIERHRNSGVFPDGMREDFAALVAMTSYLSYRYGGLYEELEERFLEEEKRRKEEAEAAQREKLAALKTQIGEIDGAAFDYIVALEERSATLESKLDSLLTEEKFRLEAENKLEAANAQNQQLQTEMHGLAAALREKYDEIQRMSKRNAQALEEADLRLQQEKAKQAEMEQNFSREYEALMEQYRLAKARNRVIAQQEQQDSGEVLYTKETFAELEAEYAAFQRFFEKQWKIAKKQIRKEQIWKKVKG